MGIALLLVLMTPQGATAGEHSKSKKSAGPVDVQLLSFMAPVRPSDTTAKQKDVLLEMPITVFLKVADEDQVSAVCVRAPRIRDAVMETVYYHPIPILKNRKLDVRKIEPLLFKATNKALRGPRITGLTVEQGAIPLKTGSSRSLASALGCGMVKR